MIKLKQSTKTTLLKYKTNLIDEQIHSRAQRNKKEFHSFHKYKTWYKIDSWYLIYLK